MVASDCKNGRISLVLAAVRPVVWDGLSVLGRNVFA
jgi:hypothetical protein